MTDPRVRAYADLLLDWSLRVEPGWQVLVAAGSEARPLVRELSAGLARRGAHALPRISFGAPFPVDLDWIAAAPEELAGTLAPLEQEALERADAHVFVLAPEGGTGAGAVPAGVRPAFRAHVTAHRARGRAGDFPNVRCDFPCAAFARAAGMTLSEYEDAFYAACLRDWSAEGARMRPIADRFAGAREVRIVGERTDLRLSLEGRPGAVDDGRVNVPGGEVYFCPVEDSVEGEVLFDVPSGGVRGVRLVLRAGEVVAAGADAGEDVLHDALATDAGARRFGELGIGCNDGIARPLHNVLFDEKVAGTIHLALGYGFERLGSRNRSDLHWDLVKDLRGGGELWVDGEVVQRDGRWLL